LNGNLQEKVYMAPPLSVSRDFEYVCKFKKALYGLKQALCAWFEKFSVVISSLELNVLMQVVSFFLYMLMT
jgi:hypothetical protein